MRINILAPCKINLSLEILEKLPNGYHKVDMVMQSVNLCDKIEISSLNSCGEIEIASDKKMYCAPENNITYKAARAFFKHTKIKNTGIKISISKNIPIGAGLGGGSSDAAAVIRGLNRFFKAFLSENELLKIAENVGSDVAFCIKGGAARAQNTGTQLSYVPCLKNCFIVLIKPDFFVSTKKAYELSENLKSYDFKNSSSMISALNSGDVSEVCKNLFNRFEEVLSDERIFKIKSDLMQSGAEGALMSGSGSVVFGVFLTRKEACDCVQKLKNTYPRIFLCEPIAPENLKR